MSASALNSSLLMQSQSGARLLAQRTQQPPKSKHQLLLEDALALTVLEMQSTALIQQFHLNAKATFGSAVTTPKLDQCKQQQ